MTTSVSARVLALVADKSRLASMVTWRGSVTDLVTDLLAVVANELDGAPVEQRSPSISDVPNGDDLKAIIANWRGKAHSYREACVFIEDVAADESGGVRATLQGASLALAQAADELEEHLLASEAEKAGEV